MSSFEIAIGTVLEHEDPNYRNRPVVTNAAGDSGGTTKFGISKAAYPALDIARLTLQDAIAIYKRDYWRGLDAVLDQGVATKVFDLGVVCGVGASVRMLQGACGACGIVVAVDGGLGPSTLSAANTLEPAQLLPAIIEEAVAHFKGIVAHNPSQAKWLNGWLIRARDMTVYPPPPGIAVEDGGGISEPQPVLASVPPGTAPSPTTFFGSLLALVRQLFSWR